MFYALPTKQMIFTQNYHKQPVCENRLTEFFSIRHEGARKMSMFFKVDFFFYNQNP